MLARRASATIERYGLLEPGEKVLVGVSGGADSVALAHVLDELGFDLVLAHLDHGLRPGSSEDAGFCRKLSAELGAGFVSHRIEIERLAKANRRSLEDEGRRARYAFFRAEAARLGCRRIAVGHTKDDQAETLLIRLVRGSGTKGLSGVHPAAANVVRPLLQATRFEIEAYLAERGLEHLEDPTNEDLRFTRNRVRHTLVPVLRDAFNPRIVEALAGSAELLREDEAWMETMAAEACDALVTVSESGATLSARSLASLHPALQRRILRRALCHVRGSVTDIGRSHIEVVLELASKGQSGRALHLPGALVERSFDELRIRAVAGGDQPSPSKDGYNRFEYRLTIPAELQIPEWDGTLTAKPVGMGTFGDVGGGKEPTAAGNWVVLGFDGRYPVLSVRSPRGGDRFRPLGAPGSKSLSRYLMEQRVSREQRTSVPLVVRGDRVDEILWVVGHSISESARRRPGDAGLEFRWVGG